MKFDENKVYTVFDVDKIKPCSKGYFADNLVSLSNIVENEYKPAYGEIDEVLFINGFTRKDGASYCLFYLVEEPS